VVAVLPRSREVRFGEVDPPGFGRITGYSLNAADAVGPRWAFYESPTIRPKANRQFGD
jgi:hypothetical protein